MLPERVINEMLANACPREKVGNLSVFEFDLHCATVRITAELISTYKEIQYNVISVEIN